MEDTQITIATKHETLVLQEFNITEAAIKEMEKQYMGLKIDGVRDKEGYERVHEAKTIVKEKMAKTKERKRELKAEILARGKQLDTTERKILALLQPIRDYLQEQEDFVETEKERIRLEKRKAEEDKLQKRLEQLAQYELMANINFGVVKGMNDEDFALYLKDKKQLFEEMEIKRFESEKEAKRINDERLAKEIADREEERIKFEAEKKEQDALIAKAKTDLEIKQKELEAERMKVKTEADNIEAQKKAIEDQKKVEELEKFRKAEEEKSRIEAERKQKETAELKEKLKPDAEKLLQIASVLRSLLMPELSSDEGRSIVSKIKVDLANLVGFIEQRAESIHIK